MILFGGFAGKLGLLWVLRCAKALLFGFVTSLRLCMLEDLVDVVHLGQLDGVSLECLQRNALGLLLLLHLLGYAASYGMQSTDKLDRIVPVLANNLRRLHLLLEMQMMTGLHEFAMVQILDRQVEVCQAVSPQMAVLAVFLIVAILPLLD